MTIDIKNENGVVTIALEGRLDTNAAPEFEKTVEEVLVEGVHSFVLDMESCLYVASSGLRIILGAQKKMNKLKGDMVVKNVSDDVMDVFEMTGFVDILTIE